MQRTKRSKGQDNCDRNLCQEEKTALGGRITQMVAQIEAKEAEIQEKDLEIADLKKQVVEIDIEKEALRKELLDERQPK